MKLQVKSSEPNLDAKSLIQRIFPVFGTPALDIPYYDTEKHMYIVDQHTSNEGNRSITYVAVNNHLCVEVSLGFYHSWTFMNKIRLMIPNYRLLNVVSTFEWPQSTYFNNVEMCEKIKELVHEYAQSNKCGASAKEQEELAEFVNSQTTLLFNGDASSLDNEETRSVLEAYCRQMKVCRDFVAFEDSLVDFQI